MHSRHGSDMIQIMRYCLIFTCLFALACGDDTGPTTDASTRDATTSDAATASDADTSDDAGSAEDGSVAQDAGDDRDSGSDQDSGPAQDAGPATDAGDDSGPADAGSGPAECSADSPCVDGACSGRSCGATWFCADPGGCTDDLVPYCSCEGVTFMDSSTCPSQPYEHTGPCRAESVSCDQRPVTCRVPTPDCEFGFLPEVEGSCYTGRCVPVDSCVCSENEACAGGTQYLCRRDTMRCTPPL